MIARIQQAIAADQFAVWLVRYHAIPPAYRMLPTQPQSKIRAALYFWNQEWNRA